ncbi:MAG: VOC family protein [Gammaproteobacteria bacterium]|jgi:predicted enzyme related to lactoylglutathione lyase|nr:VOC family protein [Gammaproteobacteria bacterium]
MHKSKLAGFIIDCQTSNLDGAASFWSEALGMPMEQLPGAEGEKYVRLKDKTGQMHVEVQSVDHASRVHLDIETDNIVAEVQRLRALGAVVVEHVHSWCVMQAPTGQRFCVVRKDSERFDQQANVWPGG